MIKILSGIILLTISALVHSQNKQSISNRNYYNTNVTFYPIIEEIKGNFKEVLMTQKFSTDSNVINYRFILDNNKRIFTVQENNKIWGIYYLDTSHRVDSLKLGITDAITTFYFKTKFHQLIPDFNRNSSKSSKINLEIDENSSIIRYFDDEKLTSIDSFDINNKLIKKSITLDNTNTYRLFSYNTYGHLAFEYIKIPNYEEPRMIGKYIYTYDKHGNWIACKFYHFDPNGNKRNEWQAIYTRTYIYDGE